LGVDSRVSARSLRRAIVVLKMRGSSHDQYLREYEISNAGVVMKTTFGQLEGIMSGNARRAPSDKFLEMFAKAART
jgi:circadian clock protein KaiC